MSSIRIQVNFIFTITYNIVECGPLNGFDLWIPVANCLWQTYTFTGILKLMFILRFIIEGEIAPETFKTELKLEIIPVTTEIEF